MEVQITKGEGVIQLFFDEFACCLVIETPLNVNWPDCRGTVGEYYAISKQPESKGNRLAESLNERLITGNEEEVLAGVKTFLNLFENGRYQVLLKTIDIGESKFFSEKPNKYSDNFELKKGFSGAFYPSPFDYKDFFYTNQESVMDSERIEYYKQLIKEGARPRILTYELYSANNDDYSSCYIIDGNHKTKAYLELGINIPSVEIIKLEDKSEQTAQILRESSKILKDFEFEHLFINSEGIENIDFVNDSYLTSKLDEILLNSNPELEIVKLFIKVNNSTNAEELNWLRDRINKLSKNKTIGKGLYLRYFGYNESLKCNCWTFDKINNDEDFNKWLKNTLPNIL